MQFGLAKFFFVVFIFATIQLWAATPKSPAGTATDAVSLDLVLDLDWTAFYILKNAPRSGQSAQFTAPPSVVSYNGETYIPTLHLAEALEALRDLIPGIRIHIFSGGTHERNQWLIHSPFLTNGKTLVQLVNRVFNVEDMVENPNPASQRFKDRKRKDAVKLIPDAVASRTLLIDDIPEFAPKGQFSISSFGRYNYHRYFSTPGLDPYDPPTKLHWDHERNKALIWVGILLESRRRSLNGEGHIAEIAHRISRDPSTGRPWELASSQIDQFIKQGERGLAEWSARRTWDSHFRASLSCQALK